MPPAPLLELSDVHLTLPGPRGPVKVLRGVDFALAAGETVGLVGPSGSGKTTLLMVAAGLESPTRGRVRLGGADLAGLDEDALARFRRRNLSLVFQAFHLIPTLTALENVRLPLELAGEPGAAARAGEALAAVGLGDRQEHYPAQLSGGEQQRVAIARAFAARPALLLADEPTGNLDRATGGLVMDLLFTLRTQAGTALLLVTHDPGLAGRCARVARMEDGRLVDAG